MMNLTSKTHQRTTHFKEFARKKVRELGIDGAVQFYRKQRAYYMTNSIYENSYVYQLFAEMSIDYIVNDLGE